jgi:hypothetical protein
MRGLFLLIRVATFFALIGTAGLFYYAKHSRQSAMGDMPYSELRDRLAITERNLKDLENREVGRDEFVSHRMMQGLLKKDKAAIAEELKFRQTKTMTVLTTGFLTAITLLHFLVTLRKPRYVTATGKAVSFVHPGKIITEGARLEYIDPDDLARKLAGGITSAEEAEGWLRTDEFLICPTCKAPITAETIGSIQEINYYEEPTVNTPEGQTQKLGSVWLAKPVDEFRCGKCGQRRVRTVRAR